VQDILGHAGILIYFNQLSHIIFMRRKTSRSRARASARKKPEPPKPSASSPKAAEPAHLISRDMEILREIRDMQIEIENLKQSILSENNMRTFESDFYREFQRLSKDVKESLEKNRHTVDRMEAEVKFLKEDLARVLSLEEEMKRISAKTVERDIESLKAKSNWLETSMKGFDIDPLVEKITELEDKIRILKASQPLILE
jgi:chromosome segregation ATPase